MLYYISYYTLAYFQNNGMSRLKIPNLCLKLRHSVNSVQLLAVINYGAKDC
jgi:hypothetical protein